jgi:hypothetical protein
MSLDRLGRMRFIAIGRCGGVASAFGGSSLFDLVLYRHKIVVKLHSVPPAFGVCGSEN